MGRKFRLNPADIRALPEWVQVFASTGDCDVAVGMLLEVSEGTLRQIYEQRGKRKAGWLANKWLNKGLGFIREDLQSLTDPILRATYRAVVAQFSYCLLPKNRLKVLTALGINIRRGKHVNQIILDLMEEEEDAAARFSEEQRMPMKRVSKQLPAVRSSYPLAPFERDYPQLPIRRPSIKCPKFIDMINTGQYYLSNIVAEVLGYNAKDLVARGVVTNRPPQITRYLAQQFINGVYILITSHIDETVASYPSVNPRALLLDCMVPFANWWYTIDELQPQIGTKSKRKPRPRPISTVVPIPPDIDPNVVDPPDRRPLPEEDEFDDDPSISYPIDIIDPEDDDPSKPIPPVSIVRKPPDWPPGPPPRPPKPEWQDVIPPPDDPSLPIPPIPDDPSLPVPPPPPPSPYPDDDSDPLPDPDIVERHPDLIDCDCDFAIRYIIRELDMMRRRGRITSAEYRTLYNLYQMYVTMSTYRPYVP